MVKFLWTFILVVIATVVKSQDSIVISVSHIHSPKKAALFSAILPGAGQVYNRKYWKVPIVVAGIGTTVYFIAHNNKFYHYYKDEYIHRLAMDTVNMDLVNFSDAGIRSAADTYQRWRDLSYISLGVVYLLNILDASVDAHLFTFDVSDDLSLSIIPTPVYNKLGISMLIRFTN